MNHSAVQQLADWPETPPDKITERKLRQYFLYLKIVKQFPNGSIVSLFRAYWISSANIRGVISICLSFANSLRSTNGRNDKSSRSCVDPLWRRMSECRSRHG